MEGKKLFCQALIHGQRRADVIRSRITNSKQVKGRLYLSVLSVLSVQSQENNIGHLADLYHIGAEKAPSAILSQRLNLRYIRIAFLDSPYVFSPVHILFKNAGVIVFISQIDIQQNRLVSLFL